MNIVILNTEARLIELPTIAPRVATGKEVVKDAVLDANGVMVTATEYMEPGALIETGYDLRKLSPGQNDVDSDYWARVCKNPGVKILLAAGWLVNKGEGAAEQLVPDIDSMDLVGAKQMILDSDQMSALTAWAASTENLGLKKLIGERKAELVGSADGRVRGPKNPKTDLGVFGGTTTAAQAEGTGEASHGIGEQA